MGKKGTESKREGMEGKRGKRGKEKGERRTGAWEREGQGNGRDGKGRKE